MNKLANKLTSLDGDESDFEDTQIAKSLALMSVHEKGKRPSGSEKTSPTSEKKKVKRVKLSKEPPFHILEHSSPNIMMVKGEVTTTQSVIDHYLELKDQIKFNDQDKLKSVATPHLISALAGENQMLKVSIIQPLKAKGNSKDKVTEIKFNMNQFSISGKVDLFKQTSELICSDLIMHSWLKTGCRKTIRN